MLRRVTYIENRKVLADSGEYTTLLGLRDVLTAIWFELRATNGASGNKANTVAECIQAVELIDGANVLYSVTGVQLAAQTAYSLGHMPYGLITEVPSNDQNCVGLLMFGRWLGDTAYALDPSRFGNLQLRVKWNLASVRAVGATGFVTATAKLTMVAEVMEGVPSPLAMLTCKQHYAFTTAASGIEAIDIPTDQRIKAILLRSYGTGGGGLYGLSNVKLQADQGKVIPVDMRVSDIQRYATLRAKPFEYKHQIYAKGTDVFYPVLKLEEGVTINAEVGDTVVSYQNYGIGNGALDITTGGVAAAAELYIAGIVQGFAPFGCIQWPFGEWDNPDTWFDASQFSKLRLDLTMNVISSAASVVLEQEYIY